ncbi:MAG: universal stress protein [Acidimicrobiales bacterium]
MTKDHSSHEGRCQVLATATVEEGSDRVVVVGLNGSSNSWNALIWACTEAIRLRGSVVAVVVIPAKDTESGLTQSPPTENRHADIQDQSDWLDYLQNDVQDYALELGVKLTFNFVQGDPVNELVRIANSHQANLIAVGRSASAYNGFAGSLGRRLVANRQVPIIIDVS